ncbi:hypothetical protein [Enterococcus durans]|uniref:hypothetical protein n=1 Tax=Enterococcus durans TaxID=53345 RepID=UPI000F78ED61|nr:hypothetical protein [Enterococcus durans]RSL36657.1 hypothetical protein B7758_06565 [Enterococcus durans]
MINNFLETKAGKRIAAGFAVFVVVVIGTIIYAFMTKEPGYVVQQRLCWSSRSVYQECFTG